MAKVNLNVEGAFAGDKPKVNLNIEGAFLGDSIQKKNPKFATVLKSRQNQRTFFLHGLKQKLDRFFNASKQLYKKMKHPRQKK